jgi:hypothetical protein
MKPLMPCADTVITAHAIFQKKLEAYSQFSEVIQTFSATAKTRHQIEWGNRMGSEQNVVRAKRQSKASE